MLLGQRWNLQNILDVFCIMTVLLDDHPVSKYDNKKNVRYQHNAYCIVNTCPNLKMQSTSGNNISIAAVLRYSRKLNNIQYRPGSIRLNSNRFWQLSKLI